MCVLGIHYNQMTTTIESAKIGRVLLSMLKLREVIIVLCV